MTDPSGPIRGFRGYIAALEAELASALRACPARQRFEVEALRKRIATLRGRTSQSVKSNGAQRSRSSTRVTG